MVVDILGTSGGVPDSGTVLGSVSIANASISTTLQSLFIDFSAFSIAVSAGTRYAIQFFSDNDFSGNVNQHSLYYGGNYAAGAAYTNNGTLGAPPTASHGSDFGFQTYVDASSVPEPTSVAIIGLGLAGLGLSRRRKKTA